MIVIVATMKAKAGKENELMENVKGLTKAVREKEPGNLEYVFHRSQKDPSVFMFYEKYQSGDAVRAHMTAPHFQDAAKKLPQLLDGGMSIETYEVLF